MQKLKVDTARARAECDHEEKLQNQEARQLMEHL